MATEMMIIRSAGIIGLPPSITFTLPYNTQYIPFYKNIKTGFLFDDLQVYGKKAQIYTTYVLYIKNIEKGGKTIE